MIDRHEPISWRDEDHDQKWRSSLAEEVYLAENRSPIEVLVDEAVARGDLRLAGSLLRLRRKGTG